MHTARLCIVLGGAVTSDPGQGGLWPVTLAGEGVVTFDPGQGEVLWPVTLLGGVVTFDPGEGGVVTCDPGQKGLWPVTLAGEGVMTFDPGQGEVLWPVTLLGVLWPLTLARGVLWPVTLAEGKVLWPLTLVRGGVVTFDPGQGGGVVTCDPGRGEVVDLWYCPPLPTLCWTEWVTHACENITFARFATRAVNIESYRATERDAVEFSTADASVATDTLRVLVVRTWNQHLQQLNPDVNPHGVQRHLRRLTERHLQTLVDRRHAILVLIRSYK